MADASSTAEPEIRTRGELIDALNRAAELEHGLALQYLFAAFSLKASLSEGGLSLAQLGTAQRWKASLFRIASQEMFHLCQVVNLTIAIGEPPHFLGGTFPGPPDPTTRLPWKLAPFSSTTLQRFAHYEEGKTLMSFYRDGDLRWCRLWWMKTVGDFYRAIRNAFDALDPVVARQGPQASGDLVDFPQLIVVRSTADARQAIDRIIEQGEGCRRVQTAEHRDRWALDSHHRTFTCMLTEYQAVAKAARGGSRTFQPVRPVVTNPVTRPENQRDGATLITAPDTVEVQNLHTAVYEAMLLMLYRAFSASPGPAERQVLLAGSLRLMTAVLYPLGETLAQLPMGEAHPRATAGPSFEIGPLPDPEEAAAEIAEGLRAAGATARRLGQAKNGRRELMNTAATLAATVEDLRELR